ncbi:hypothetical protein V2J09_019074 [Rumex salicifolius]
MAALSSSILATPPVLLKNKLALIPATQFVFPLATLSTHSLSFSQKPTTLRTRLGLQRPNAAQIDSPATADVAGEVVSSIPGIPNGDGTSVVIQVLLIAAFLGLSVLTIGVIYLGVTDFLQKRERDKLEKEEASKKKRSRKKARVRARTGPRGFGQKIEEDED